MLEHTLCVTFFVYAVNIFMYYVLSKHSLMDASEAPNEHVDVRKAVATFKLIIYPFYFK